MAKATRERNTCERNASDGAASNTGSNGESDAAVSFA